MTRVVITGIAVISPIGSGREEFWTRLLAGTSGIGPVESFDTSAFPVHIGAEVRGFRPEEHLRRLNPADTGRASQFAAAAARAAVADAGLDPDRLDARQTGVSMGTTSGEPLFIEQYNDVRKREGEDAVPQEIFPRYPCHVIPANVATELGVHGPAS